MRCWHATLGWWASCRTALGWCARGGQLCPEWRALLLKYPDRFVVGSDTWVNQRWQHYEAQMRDYRTWLGGLPVSVGQRVAWGDAAAVRGVEGR